MNDDDDLSKTMVIPNPGGRRKAATEVSPYKAPETPSPVSQNVSQSTQANIEVQGENKLLTYARDMLILAGNLRTLEPNNSVEQMRQDIENLFSQFDRQLAQDNVAEEIALTARYMLCCLTDELVLTTPWGLESSWSHQTLLGKYHNETSGGEKFFLIVNKLMEQPQRNIDLIELAYVCLSLGFRGKYRIVPTGENDIAQVSYLLYQPIILYRPQSGDLSPSWQGASDDRPSFEKRVSPALFFIILAFICVAAYIALLSNLHAKSSPLYEKIESIGWDNFVAQIAENPSQRNLAGIGATISASLAESIAKQQVTVDVKDGMLIVRLVSTQLFPPSSTRVSTQELPNVNTLVSAIAPFADALVIVGHTDATGRADSNWVISRKRAEAVEAWLKTANTSNDSLIQQTITRGVADTQPLVDESDSDADQSLNRRVELILMLKDNMAA